MNFQKLLRPVPAQAKFELEGWHVWCGSMTRDEFEAWVTHSEIAYAVADNPLGPFHHVATVWTCRDVAASWDSDVVHNPAILRHGNRYYLYYMGTRGPDFDLDQPADEATWWAYRNNQRIDVAMADHPAGPWTREEGRVTADKTITLPEHVLKSTRDEGSRLVLQWDAMRCPALNITVNDESTTTILWGAHQLDLISCGVTGLQLVLVR